MSHRAFIVQLKKIANMRQQTIKFGRLLLFVFLLCCGGWVGANKQDSLADYTAQGKQFLDAKTALQHGRIQTFKKLAKKLREYPLYAYLQFDYIKRNLARKPAQDIEDFLHTYADSLLAGRLRRLWLPLLARNKDWYRFFQQYKPLVNPGTKLRCYHAQGLFSTGRYKEAMRQTEQLWIVGKSQPKVCDPSFAMWEKRSGMTVKIIWQRIGLAMAKSRLSLTKFLAKQLSSRDRRWVKLWHEMHARPARVLALSALKQNIPIVRKIVRHGIKRLSRRDAGAAATAWSKVREQHLVDGDAFVLAVDRYVAMRGGYQQHPDAVKWLSNLAESTQKIREWRIRTALAQQDWWAALTWIDALPNEEKKSGKWQYWRARILEIQSKLLPELYARAERIYLDVAQERSYYGFLAADRMARDYQWEYRPLVFTKDELVDVTQRLGIIRALELYRLNLYADARREWNHEVAQLDIVGKRKASVLASQHGWHDRAIATVAKGAHFDDLKLRFPIAHRQQIHQGAKENNIDPAWVYGVVRQESGFMVDARSHAGALGLMQLMPQTGRMTARKLNIRLRSNKEILDIKKNIRLGAAYLRRMLDRNNGNNTLATASYNAGPHRVKKWLPKQPIDADLWVVAIPYHETRQYVRRVMAYTVIYNHRLGGKLTRMRSRMPMVKPFNG